MSFLDADRSLESTQWPDNLDVKTIRLKGYNRKAFTQFVIKVHSRCNLACNYCYVYESHDQSWQQQPKMMQESTFVAACRQIAEHARDFSLPSVNLVFHGGEPLLIGARMLDRFATLATEIIGAVTALRLGIQTNGLLFTSAVADVCDRHRIRVAVSVDGDESGHDRHRRFRDGSGSYAGVATGIRLLTSPRYRHLFAGLLCVLDIRNDPVATYEALLQFRPPIVDFLLPHGNWSTPPPAREEGGPVTYGRWLTTVFDRWYTAPERETGVRLFDDIMALTLGGNSTSEWIGLLPVRVAVIETDGTLEQVDTLKTAYSGATKIHALGHRNPLHAALDEPHIVARQLGVEALSDTCRRCALHNICGAGDYTHRFREGSGFRNPSVYCPDLTFLIRHISTTVINELTTLRTRR